VSRSILLQLARDSIEEVLQAQTTIDKASLLKQHPLLNEKIPTTLNLFKEEELKGSYSSKNEKLSLINAIILAAKKAAFEDETSSILTTSEYLHCEIELILETPNGLISEKDPPIIRND